jgi:putative flippase GtrA
MVKDFILTLLNMLYLPFRRLVPFQTFKYAACGAGNTLLDIFIYFISYNFILQKQIVYTPLGDISPHLGAIKPHIAAFLMAFVISFPIGFYLNRYIVFSESLIRGRVQLLRYFSLVIICILLNYYFIKLFVEQFHIYPTVSKILTTVIVVSFSYVTQKHFTFKVKKA